MDSWGLAWWRGVSQCGVKQGDPLSPLLFGLFIDELEQWLRERLPGAGVQLGPKLLQMLLYADDLVLFAPNPQMLQQQLDHLHQFCLAKGMEVNVAKTEVVVFRHPQFPAAGEAWQWQIDGQPVARSSEFRYLGVILHETEGVSAAISSLATAATRATWAMISRFRVRKVRDIAVKLQMFRALVLPILEYCGAIWGPDMLASSKHLSQVLDNPLQAVQTTFLRGLGQLRTSVSKTVLHKEMCMEPVAKGWLRSSIALWERLQAAPSNSILGITVRESIKRAQAAPKRNTSWAGRFLSMMHMITGQGSRDDAATVQDFVKQFGFDSTADRILPVPSGVMWAAWEKFVQVEPWENLESNPRTAPTARIRLVTYNNWFAVPHGTGGTQEKGYPPGMPNYIKHSGGIPFSQIKQLIRFRTGAHHLRVETERWVPAPARLPRSERVCQKCTLGSVMEDEYHVLFECPTYHHIRLKYEEALFSNFGGVSRAARSMRPSGKVSAFMNQNPRKVAAFVSECLDYRRFEASDLLPYATRETLEELGLVGYQIDTFSSDYDDYIDESGMVYDAHGA